MDFLSLSFIADFIRISNDAWVKGWHERNGGNLSYRLKKEDIQHIQSDFKLVSPFIALPIHAKELANAFFLVTGSGGFFRNIELKPEENIGIIQIDNEGKGYRLVWGLKNNPHPTSELPTHLLTHATKQEQNPGQYRAVMHGHPPNLIALTFVLPLDSAVFTKELWEMISECSVVFPKGIGVLPWLLPGSVELAEASSKSMKQHDAVIWSHHGILCAGESLDLAFGLIDTIEKAAEILVKVLSMGGKKQFITQENLDLMAQYYGITLNK